MKREKFDEKLATNQNRIIWQRMSAKEKRKNVFLIVVIVLIWLAIPIGGAVFGITGNPWQ